MRKTATLSIRLPEDLADFLQEIAERTGMPPSTIARMSLEDFRQRVAETGQISFAFRRSATREDGAPVRQSSDGAPGASAGVHPVTVNQNATGAIGVNHGALTFSNGRSKE